MLASPFCSAAAFFSFVFSRALVLAVVDNTAVANLPNGLLSRRLCRRRVREETRSRIRDEVEIRSLEKHLSNGHNQQATDISYLQITVQPNDRRRLKRQASTVRQRVPVPEMAEENHAYNGIRVPAARPALQANRDIASPQRR